VRGARILRALTEVGQLGCVKIVEAAAEGSPKQRLVARTHIVSIGIG
jgi:hypothetical protein